MNHAAAPESPTDVPVRSVVCHGFGPVAGLTVVESAPTPLGPGQVRVRVTAAGVNHVDGLFVQGRYQIKPPLPFVPGSEIVGNVVEVADDVAAGAPAGGVSAVGERVFANVGLGGYASEVVVRADRCVRLDDRLRASLSDAQAATFSQSYLTGWFAFRERARVRSGDTMLVLGAGGGVGLAAVDLGRSLGLRVIAAASSEDKLALARERGAEATILTTGLDPSEVKDRARAFGVAAGGDGVDLVYDPVGGELGESCLRALGEDGQYLVIGFVAGIPRLPANQVLLRNRRIVGVDWGAWAGRHPERNARLLSEVLDLVEQGSIAPVDPVPYPLDEAPRALADLESRRLAGKAVLVP